MEASVVVNVPFFDLDPMCVVWHGNYVKYFEIARCALLKKLRLSYEDMRDMGYLFPVVKMSVKFISPAEFNQDLEVCASIVESDCYLQIKYLVRDLKSGAKICSGETKQMCVSAGTKQSFFELPRDVKERLSCAS